MAEVEERLIAADAFSGSTTRGAVWSDFLDLVALIQKQRIRVPAAFVGGGFTTASLDPSDVDASILVDASRITAPPTWQKLELIMANVNNDPKIKLDAFVINWYPEGDERLIPPGYLTQRGKWDDWWQRYVAKADRHPPQRHHAMPVRGYLEVIFDGYT